MTRGAAEDTALHLGPNVLDPFLDGFTRSMLDLGYHINNLTRMRHIIRRFGRYLTAHGVELSRVGHEHVDSFRATLPHSSSVMVRSTITFMVDYLQRNGVSTTDSTPRRESRHVLASPRRVTRVYRPTWNREPNVLEAFLLGFADQMCGRGYSVDTIMQTCGFGRRFGRHLTSQSLDPIDVTERHIDDFLAGLPPTTLKARGGSLRQLLEYLRAIGVARPAAPRPSPPVAPFTPLIEEWLGFLRRHRGLAEKSLELYKRQAVPFLEFLGPDASLEGLRRLQPSRVREYILHVGGRRSRCERGMMLTSLRGLLGFAHARGYVARDLALAIARERVPRWRHDRLPRGPRWDDVLRLPATVDRSRSLGLRDYAILQILICYGVRASQVAGLQLEDIDWRASRIAFPASKGSRSVQVPLVGNVGEAIIDYLRRGRPPSSSRTTFLSSKPPFAPIRRAAIRHVTARAFDLAAVSTPRRGPHAIRHSWAARAMAQGEPLKTISDLLGHRRIESTRIYAKVDIAHLRDMSLPWPSDAAR